MKVVEGELYPTVSLTGSLSRRYDSNVQNDNRSSASVIGSVVEAAGGLVRLRVRKSSEELSRIFDALLSKVQEPGGDSPFAEITDEDIDNLFND